MVRLACRRYGACLFALAFAASVSKAQDVWIGGFPDDNVDTASNWMGGVVPPGYMSGTDVLEFTSSGGSNMNVDTAGVSFSQITTDSDGDNPASINLLGSNAITIGSGGILLHSVEDEGATFTSSAPIILEADQTWQADYNGYIEVSGVISGSGALTLAGGDYQTYQFDNGANSFTGGLTVSGDQTVVGLGATGTPLGTGLVVIGDGVQLQPTIPGTITLPNTFTFGDESNGSPVEIGGYPNGGPASTSIVFSGFANFDTNGEDNNSSEIDLTSNTQVTFAGTVSGLYPGTTLVLGTSYEAVNSVFIFRGTIGPNIDFLNLTGNASVILDGAPVTQFATVQSINTQYNNYLGLGISYSGHVSDFINSPQMDPGGFNGTLGFDNTTGGVSIFGDAIDLTNFTNDFIGLGSATKGQPSGASNVILTGLITPPRGLVFTGGEEPAGGSYEFGGGGGTLQVTNQITDGDWIYDGDNPVSNSLFVSGGNAPLTLILSGPLTYTGSTYVSGNALIIDAPFPSENFIGLGEDGDPAGYVGTTTNSGFLNDDAGAMGTHPQDFINLISTESGGVVGFDDLTGATRMISGTIDMTGYPGLYLGTATKVNYSGTIIPNDDTFRFSGVKGGQVTVSTPSIGEESSVVVGFPEPIESFGSVSSVIMTGNNYYNGGTTLNSGYLYVATSNSIGSAPLEVPGPSGNDSSFVGLAPYMAPLTLGNEIDIPSGGMHLNYASSPYTMYLTGSIHDYNENGSLIVDGPVSLSGGNDFSGTVTVNGTTLSIDNDEALYDSSGVLANAGSTINFTTISPYVESLNLTGASANFTMDESNPEIDELSMAMGSHLTFATGSTPYVYGLVSDEPNSGNLITLNAGTALTFDFDADPDYHGTFAGPASSNVTVQDGELNLYGSSTAFSGAMTVGAYGFLIASNDNALGTGTVTVQQNGVLATNTGVTLSNPLVLQAGGQLAGYGTFNAGNGITIGSNSQLTPGTAGLNDYGTPGSIPVIGTLSFGATTPLTFDGGGYLVIGVQDANGAAGTGYGTVVANGGLTISATSWDPFNISLLSFAQNSNVTGESGVYNFDSSMPYSWTLVSASTAISGFDPSFFNIDTSEFLNDLGPGQFFVSVSGDNLLLNFTPVPEPSTWALIGAGALVLGAVGLRRSRRSA